MRVLVSLLVVAAAAPVCALDLELRLDLDETALMCFEPVSGVLEIINRDHEPAHILGGPYYGRGTVHFELIEDGEVVRQVWYNHGDGLAPTPIDLGPGECIYLPVLLARNAKGFLLDHPGRYQLRCVIRFTHATDVHPWSKQDIASSLAELDVRDPGRGSEMYRDCSWARCSKPFLHTIESEEHVLFELLDRMQDYDAALETLIVYNMAWLWDLGLPGLSHKDLSDRLDWYKTALDVARPIVERHGRGRTIWDLIESRIDDMDSGRMDPAKDRYKHGDVILKGA